MARLINKLNMLVKSSVSGVLKDAGSRRPVQPLAANVDKAIANLRQQINDALDQLDRTEADIAALNRQIAAWDQEADRALQDGDEATARHLIRQIQLAQQQRAMLVSNLAQHQHATSELIRQVNALEGSAAEAQTAESAPPQPDGMPEASDETAGPRSVSLAEQLRRVQQTASDHGAALSSTRDAPPGIDESAVEDDITQRRQRLSS